MALPTYGALPVQIDPTAWGGRTNTPPASLTVDSIQNQIAAQLVAFFASGSLAIPVYIYPAFDLDTWWASSARRTRRARAACSRQRRRSTRRL